MESFSTVVVYDFETTGIDVLEDRVVQVAAVLLERTGGDGWRERASFVSYVNPSPRRMAPRAQQVTGIDPRRLAAAPPFREVWERLVGALGPGEHMALVGHNTRGYDDLLLAAELERVGLDPRCPFGGRAGRIGCFDTLQAARSAGERGLQTADLKLATLFRASTGEVLEGAHDALADCRGVVALLQWRPLRGWLRREPWEDRLATLRERRLRRNPPPPPPKSPEPPAAVPGGHRRLASQRRCERCNVCFSLYFRHTCAAA